MDNSFDDFVKDLQNQILDETRAAYGEAAFQRWLKPLYSGIIHGADAEPGIIQEYFRGLQDLMGAIIRPANITIIIKSTTITLPHPDECTTVIKALPMGFGHVLVNGLYVIVPFRIVSKQVIDPHVKGVKLVSILLELLEPPFVI